MEQDLKNRYEPFLAAGKKHHPEIVEELEGWADGSGVPFKDLMAYNLKNELSTLMRKRPRETPGCSTVVLAAHDRLLIAHNEDGDKAYDDLMFLALVRQPGKPAFLCLNYPGILSGNGPVMNDAGMVVTTNFISSRAVRLGVPRYFISRAAIQARTTDELVAIVTHPERAYAFHFNVGSRAEGKVLSVETSTEKHEVQTVSGLYVHTNHLVLPGMQEIEQDEKYVGTSSMSRYRALTNMARMHRERLHELDWRALVKMLSSHQGRPYSPCRHPVEGVAEPVSGSTLGSAVFDVRRGSLRLFNTNPCRNRQRSYQPF
jgi:isopenicillin-N N-acyltransferase-like protein